MVLINKMKGRYAVMKQAYSEAGITSFIDGLFAVSGGTRTKVHYAQHNSSTARTAHAPQLPHVSGATPPAPPHISQRGSSYDETKRIVSTLRMSG